MDLIFSESVSSAHGRRSSLTGLQKYLSLYSEPDSPDEFPFSIQAFKTMPNPINPGKEFGSAETTGQNSKNHSFSGDLKKENRLKRQSFLYKQENKNLLKEIQILNKGLKAKNNEIRKMQMENVKYKKIVEYMLEELNGENKEFDYLDDVLPFIIKKFSVVKNTVINTQKAYLKEKELNKKIKKENLKLQSENLANIELIVKMNELRESEIKDPILEGQKKNTGKSMYRN